MKFWFPCPPARIFTVKFRLDMCLFLSETCRLWLKWGSVVLSQTHFPSRNHWDLTVGFYESFRFLVPVLTLSCLVYCNLAPNLCCFCFFFFRCVAASDFQLHTVTLIPGDGIGPEISTAVAKIFEAAKVRDKQMSVCISSSFSTTNGKFACY